MAILQQIMSPFKRSNGKTFNCLQIEASSNCFLRCIMCPRTALLNRWKSKDMPFETFERISRHFADTKLVYLSGWGEPLLNERIFDMVKLAKDSGLSVGFTTNGMLLTKEVCRRLVDLELDIVSVSVAGATKHTHESIRVGSDFGRIMTNIKVLGSLKDSFKSEKPKIILLLLMVERNMSELPSSVGLARNLGADELVATNLTYAATSVHDEIRTFSCEKASKSFVGAIKEAEQKAKELGIVFRSYPLEIEERLVCEEDPLNNVYISSDGNVSPCVYLNPPMRDIPRVFCGHNHTIQRTYFGNVNQMDLFEIWDKEDYRFFREKFKKRLAVMEGIFEFSTNRLRSLDRVMKINALPKVCKTCYKAYGI